LISVYMHGKPCSFTGIKTSTGITTRFWYCDDLYGFSQDISTPSPDDSHHIYFAWFLISSFAPSLPHTSFLVYFISYKLLFNHLYLHPLSSVYVFLVLVVVLYMTSCMTHK
jgi:hypothetical protein